MELQWPWESAVLVQETRYSPTSWEPSFLTLGFSLAEKCVKQLKVGCSVIPKTAVLRASQVLPPLNFPEDS